MPRISVVTVCFNSARTIAGTLQSVAGQIEVDAEHIIVDGKSTDETMATVERHRSPILRTICEPDRGIYDAMNKGIRLANGEIVAFLNSDDRYADERVLADVVSAFSSGDYDYIYGDIKMINAEGEVARTWITGVVPPQGLNGMIIPHPALFVRRDVLNAIVPTFDPNYRIAADLKFQLILINKMKARGLYLRHCLALMRLGGVSTAGISARLLGWAESTRAYNEVFGSGGYWFTIKKASYHLKSLRTRA